MAFFFFNEFMLSASDDDGEMLLAKPWSGYYLPKQPITALSPWLTLEENGPFFIWFTIPS